MKKLIFITLFFSLLTQAFARDLTITVFDRDLDFPLEGVRIQEAESGQEIFTDFNGIGVLELDDSRVRAILVIELIGYETKKQLVTDLDSPVNIYMLMEGVLEGEELVVEVEAIGETDAEVGVSTVVEEEVIQSAAKIGFIEDAMAVVKILPGVSYSGGMASNLSIRGSDPSGLLAIMDGMIVSYPYHFGGMVSIFNPNIVESIKFSPGIFSVKHGQATSALLEVNTKTPDDGTKFSVVGSSSTNEAFFETTLGKEGKGGILGGARLTYWEPAMRAMGWFGEQINDEGLKYLTSTINTYPFIHDFYLKGFYSPSNSFKWYINGFSGNDGLGIKIGDIPGFDPEEEVLLKGNFDYTNHDLIVSTGISALPLDNFLINYVIGYDYKDIRLDTLMGYEGRQFYSDLFKETYGVEEDSVYIDFDDSNIDVVQISNRFQTRLDLDYNVKDSLLIQGGGGTYYETYSSDSEGFMHLFVPQEDYSLKYQRLDFDYEAEEDFRISSFGYLNFNGDFISNKLSLEAGVRVDHFYQDIEYNGIIDTGLVPAPRMRLTISPEDSNQLFTKNKFSIGSGLFNIAPWDSGGGKNPDKSLTSVAGWDTYLPFGLHLKMEGYYKYIYDRTYSNTPISYTTSDELEDLTIHHDDGYGHIGGGDLLLERSISRYIDGMMSYTFVYARYMEPTLEDGYEYNENREAPRGKYYWPSFHRFHSLNMLLNVKPTNSFTITTKFSLASGLPERDYEETVTSQTVYMEDGTPFNMQLYDQKNLYSDSRRADFELPLDIKFTWHNYLPESKYNWEIYFGVQNVLAPLLVDLDTSPGEQSNMLSEQDSSDGGFAFPTPSIGFKLSF